MRPPCGLRIPTTNWHGRLPLLFWERVGVRGNMRPPCGLREPYNKWARSAPSPLWGEGWGEGEHAASLWAEGSLQKYWHGRLPLLFGERAGVRGYMRLRWWFRSPYVLHFSASRVTRERARGARRLPPGYPGSRQRKSPLRGALSLFLQAFGSGTSLHPCRLCPLGASLRLAPACGQRFGDFQPDSRSLTLLSRLNVARVLIPPCHVHGLCNAMFC